jgi:LPS sulfotransferase NodH
VCDKGAFRQFTRLWPERRAGMTGYVICATPRSGGTLLCGMLAATGQLGAPDSFWMGQNRVEWCAEWGVDTAPDEPGHAAAFLAAARKAGDAGTGVFGMRLMAEDRAGMMAELGGLLPGLPSDLARLQRAFGPLELIHLSRADKVAQAVSRVKAEQTGLWHRAPDGSEIERLAPPAEPAFDFDHIHRMVTALETWDAAWEAWFRRQRIAPLRLVYEEVAADPVAAVRMIAGRLGVALETFPEVGTARLSDDLNHNWIARYRHASCAD